MYGFKFRHCVCVIRFPMLTMHTALFFVLYYLRFFTHSVCRLMFQYLVFVDGNNGPNGQCHNACSWRIIPPLFICKQQKSWKTFLKTSLNFLSGSPLHIWCKVLKIHICWKSCEKWRHTHFSSWLRFAFFKWTHSHETIYLDYDTNANINNAEWKQQNPQLQHRQRYQFYYSTTLLQAIATGSKKSVKWKARGHANAQI